MESPFRILTNLSINLQAAGPAAIICTWLACVLLLALLGQGDLARSGLITLQVAGGMILAGLLSRA